ncbi:MAG: hypothetical protein PHF50_01865 [Patescibacteria group bacterium]|nr:hypothetical protein [Patescibacteria group bacterium]
MLKTIASLGKEKYERIGAIKAKEIFKGMDYTTRSKLKPEAVNLGTGKISVLNFIKRINKAHGAVVASKVIRAAQKHFNDDIDPAIQKRYMKINMQRDDSFLKEKDTSNKNISILGKVGGGVHGDASKLGVGITQARSRVSALSSNANVLSNNSMPKASAAGGIKKPIGF